MAAQKFLTLISGVFTEIQAILTSAGAGSSGLIPALDSTGRLDQTFMPVGVVPDVKSIVTSENLSAGNLVNIYDNSSVPTARKADCSNGRVAMGFVLAATTSPAAAIVYFPGVTNTGLSAMTTGILQYLSTAGGISSTAPSTSGYISQQVGYAASPTELPFNPQIAVTLA